MMTLSMLVLLFVIAFFYASVGHGGASGYLALMVLYGLHPVEMRSSALLLNVFVAGIAFYQFYRQGYFKWSLFYPLAILSVPMAFIGANIHLETKLYKYLLAICLVIAAIRLLGVGQKSVVLKQKPIKLLPAFSIGGIIGLISGLIGIGGGILLSPILIFLRWATFKETAAVSALFIFVNSLAGMAGLLYQKVIFSPQILSWILAALLGGSLGSLYGSRTLNQAMLRFLLSAVLLFASVKLIII